MFVSGLARMRSCRACLPLLWASPSVRWLFGMQPCLSALVRSSIMHWSMRALPSRSCLSRFRLMARPWLTPMLSLAHCRLTVLPAMTWLLALAMPHPARLFAGAPTSGAVVPSALCCRRPSMPCSRLLRRWCRSSLRATTRCPPSRSGRVQSGPCSRGRPRGP